MLLKIVKLLHKRHLTIFKASKLRLCKIQLCMQATKKLVYCAVEVVNYAHFPLVELFISELRESLTARNSHDGAGFAAKSCQTTKCAICMCDFFPRKKRGGGKTCCFVSSATVGKSGKKECCSVIKHNVMYCFEVVYTEIFP